MRTILDLRIKRLLLCLAFVLPLTAFAFGPGIEFYLRKSVMESSHIVIGKVVDNAPFSRTSPDRLSTVVVEQVIYGPSSEGDSLFVKWRANQWFSANGGRIEVACGGSTQLDTLIEKSALWLLRESEGIACVAPPIQVRKETINRLHELVRAVENPDTNNVAVAIFRDLSVDLEADPESEIKRSSFVAFLRKDIESRRRVGK